MCIFGQLGHYSFKVQNETKKFGKKDPRESGAKGRRNFRVHLVSPRLIDYQQVRLGHARSSFARDFIASTHVNDVYYEVSELTTEVGGKIITSALKQDEVRRVLSAQRLESRGTG